MFQTLLKKVSNWWFGEPKIYDPPIIGGYMDRHWIPSTLSRIGSGFARNWKFWVGVVLVPVVLCIATIYFHS